MERGQLASLKRKLQEGGGADIEQVAGILTRLGRNAPAELLCLLAARVRDGCPIASDSLAKLICSTGDIEFYRAVEGRLRTGGIWCQIKLLGAGIPDPAIEQRLCDDLYRNRGPTDASRSFIARSLRDHGSTGCLETLEAIDHETFGEYQTALAVDQMLGGVPATVARSETLQEFAQKRLDDTVRKGTIEFRELVRSAIAAVRERGSPAYRAVDLESRQDSAIFAGSRDYARRAAANLPDDIGDALNNVRKSLEALLKAVAMHRGIEANKDKPLNEYLLDDLFKLVRANFRIPKHINIHLESIQRYSTMGSHDQGLPVEQIGDEKIVRGLLTARDIVERYFASALSTQRTQ